MLPIIRRTDKLHSLEWGGSFSVIISGRRGMFVSDLCFILGRCRIKESLIGKVPPPPQIKQRQKRCLRFHF